MCGKIVLLFFVLIIIVIIIFTHVLCLLVQSGSCTLRTEALPRLVMLNDHTHTEHFRLFPLTSSTFCLYCNMVAVRICVDLATNLLKRHLGHGLFTRGCPDGFKVLRVILVHILERTERCNRVPGCHTDRCAVVVAGVSCRKAVNLCAMCGGACAALLQLHSVCFSYVYWPQPVSQSASNHKPLPGSPNTARNVLLSSMGSCVRPGAELEPHKSYSPTHVSCVSVHVHTLRHTRALNPEDRR